MSVEEALDALRVAAERKPATCLLDEHPEAVKILEQWVLLRKDKRNVSYEAVADIISKHIGVPTTGRRVRAWMETHHRDLITRGR